MKRSKPSSGDSSGDPSGGNLAWQPGEIKPGRTESQSPLAPGLYLTATPIGHARDISLRALDVLRGCDAIAAEDTRVTAKLLAIHGVSKPLTAYNDHNAVRERPKLLGRLRQGARIALVSDAGTPLVADPGYKLVREAIADGISVHAVPGASAALAALSLSGLPTDRFLFAGFLPPKSAARRSTLAELKSLSATLVFFESPHRLSECLADMVGILGGRAVAVARELTKLHEECRRGDLAGLAAHYAAADPPKGEITIVVGPPVEYAPDTTLADSLLDKALAFMPVRAAAELVAEATGQSRHALYERALGRKDRP
ncbi:MAG: 16S rRNA (cytidine(1402)-2'-O)-methyltransferase [Rhizomicrobium sp.]